MKSTNKFLVGLILGVTLLGISSAALPGLTPFYLSDNGTNWVTSVSTYELGSSAQRIAKIWATAIDVSSCTGCGGSATSTFGFITATTTNATSSFAGNVSITGNLTLTGVLTAPVAISAASDIRPSSDGNFSLGTGALRWLNTYTQNLFATSSTVTGNGTFGGTLGVTGATTLATTTVGGDFRVNGTYIPRVIGYASASTVTVTVNTTDIATTTIDRTTTFANPTGIKYDGQMFELLGMATVTQTVAFGTQFASSTDLNNVTSVASGTTRWLFEYNAVRARWDLVGLLKTYDR